MRKFCLPLFSCIAALCVLGTTAFASPAPRYKSKAAIEREVALVVKGTITKSTKSYDSKTRVRTNTILVKVSGVKARNTALNTVVKPGQFIRFSKSCTKRKGPPTPTSQESQWCGSLWAQIPQTLTQKKGSKITLKLRVLRSASRIVLATISHTITERGVIKGTVHAK